ERNEITHFIEIEQDVTERKQHERDLESIVIIADALRNARTRSEMLPVILTEMVDILHADTVTISLYDPTANEMIFSLAHGLLTALSGLRLPANEGLLGYLTASREIYLTRNALEETRLKTGLFTEPIALAAVPLLTQGQLVGLLWVGRKAEFSQNEVRLMSATADIAANAIYRSSLFEETEQRLQRLSALHEVDKALTTNLETKVTLGILIEQVVSQLAVHAADVLLWNSQSQTFEFLTGSGFRNILAPALRATGQGLSQRVVEERRVISIPDINAVPAETAARLRMRGEEFAAYFGAPLIIKGEVKGVLEVFNRSPFSPNADWHKFFDQLSAQAAIAIDTAQLVDSLQRSNDNLKTAYEDTIEGWARVLDQKDQVTEGHSRRVTEQTIDLARAAGIAENEIVHIRRGALLHDIGKLLIPDEILKKTGPLTEEQWKIMRLHPQYAYDWLWPIEYLRPAIDIPYCHHEHWDGSGYPRGLAGEDIPLAARVFSIIDVFDALSHPRPYRGGWERERILTYIQEQSGKQFDPALVELFLRLVGSIPPEIEDLAAT
ncbi:MAG TPA: HD domain-containing phosphohydrolase, partial [Anaerolineaceae bacterium]